MSPILASRSLWADSQEAHWTPSQETLVLSVSQNLSKNFTSLHKNVLSLRLAGEYWSRSKFAARRGGLERVGAVFGPVAIGGSWSDVPVPATEEATCQHHHHYQHHQVSTLSKAGVFTVTTDMKCLIRCSIFLFWILTFRFYVLDFDLNQSRNGIPITQRGVVWTAIVENRIRGVMDKPQPDYYKVGGSECFS